MTRFRETTMKPGDPVLYEHSGIVHAATVLQCQLRTVPDKTAEDGVRYDEEVVLTYFDPKHARPVMSQVQMEEAMKRVYGAMERTETNKNGYIRCRMIGIGPFAEGWNRRYAGKTDPTEPQQLSAGDEQEGKMAKGYIPTREEWAKAGYDPAAYDNRFVMVNGVLTDTAIQGAAATGSEDTKEAQTVSS